MIGQPYLLAGGAVAIVLSVVAGKLYLDHREDEARAAGAAAARAAAEAACAVRVTDLDRAWRSRLDEMVAAMDEARAAERQR